MTESTRDATSNYYDDVGVINWANAFTIMRLPLGAFGLYLYSVGNELIGLIVLVVAALTDMADGQVARRFNCRTWYGEKLDPIVDVTGLVIVAVWSFWHIEPGFWPTIVVIIAFELIKSAVTGYAFRRGVDIKTAESGRWAIAARASFVLVVLMVSDNVAWETTSGIFISTSLALFYIVALALSIYTFIGYVSEYRSRVVN